MKDKVLELRPERGTAIGVLKAGCKPGPRRLLREFRWRERKGVQGKEVLETLEGQTSRGRPWAPPRAPTKASFAGEARIGARKRRGGGTAHQLRMDVKDMAKAQLHG